MATVGSASPAIDTSTSTSDSECVVDTDSYSLSSSVSGISMVTSGAITVDTANAIAPTSLTVSVTINGGAETLTSSAFSVEVKSCLSLISFTSLAGSYSA